MKSTTEQAWALPVDIVSLGAHLTAYVTLRPIIDTLRLCNRFGPADTGISKLPIELVEHVEHYLMEDMRGQERKVWAQGQKCFEGRCDPVDHFNNDDFHEIYHRMQEFHDLEWAAGDRLCIARDDHRLRSGARSTHTTGQCEVCVALGPIEPHSKAHVANQRVKVQGRLEQLRKDNSHRSHRRLELYNERWNDTCYDSQESWYDRIGSNRGYVVSHLDKMSNMLRQDFGLQIRVVHGPWRPDQDDLQETTFGPSRPTSAYLQRPVSQSATGRTKLPAFGTELFAQFGRAVRILGLEVVQGTEEVDYFEDDSEEDHSNEDYQDVVDATDSILTEHPRLVTFSKYADDYEGDMVWISDCNVSPEMHGSLRGVDAEEWMWAVVKPQRPKISEASTELST